jgi:hypothetical protein
MLRSGARRPCKTKHLAATSTTYPADRESHRGKALSRASCVPDVGMKSGSCNGVPGSLNTPDEPAARNGGLHGRLATESAAARSWCPGILRRVCSQAGALAGRSAMLEDLSAWQLKSRASPRRPIAHQGPPSSPRTAFSWLLGNTVSPSTCC